MKKIMWFSIGVLFAALLPSFAAATENESGSITKSFSVNKGGKLEVEIGGGDIRIKPWEKNEVFIQVEGIDESESDRLKMNQSGNTITVQYRPKWGWLGFRTRDARFEINVPSQFDLDLETSGGDIEITESLTGSLKGSTSGGDIRLADVGGTVEMKTSGGDVQAKKIHGSGVLKTSGGDIKVGTVSGDLEVTTSGGSIKVENVGKTLTAKTAGGDLIIGDVGGEATVSTAGGDVKVGKVSGKASLSTAGGDIELQSGSGFVTAKTSGGDVKLENVFGSVEAKTSGGDVSVELIPSGKGNSKLTSAGGDLRLSLPENARATIDARIRVHSWWGGREDEYEILSDFKADSYEKDKDTGEIRAHYILNGGGETILLSTANANIEIKKLKK